MQCAAVYVSSYSDSALVITSCERVIAASFTVASATPRALRAANASGAVAATGQSDHFHQHKRHQHEKGLLLHYLRIN